ncbi:MAG: hypothetical protein WHS88_10160 [Anaerohalosphaeraceae bacterium]
MAIWNTFSLLFGFAATAAIILGKSPWTVQEILNHSVELFWCLSPYAAFGLLNLFFIKTNFGKILVSASIFFVVWGSLYLYSDSLYIHSDPQSPLLLLFIPLYQNSLALLIFLICSSHLLAMKTKEKVFK